MPSYTIPKGPLVSFGAAITFNQRRSRLIDWGLGTSEEEIDTIGDTNQMDLAGYTDLSFHGIYVWRYSIYCNASTTVQAMQDELTSIITAAKTRNGDGTTGQVALLTVKLAGYTNTTASGIARLKSVENHNPYPTREELTMTFLLPRGFSY